MRLAPLWLLLLPAACLCAALNVRWGPGVTHPSSLPVLPHFWTSTGFSPLGGASTALSSDERTNLALVGSLPHGALTHVRVHWLLDLVTAKPRGRGGKSELQFDFSRLDELLAWLHRHNLAPGLELMGNPSGLFTDLGKPRQRRRWRQLVRALVSRYRGAHIYGMKTIKKWRFETWNEPDLQMYNTLNFTLESYLAYFWSSVAGLREGSGGELRLGGPAGLFREPREHHPLCWGLLDAVHNNPSNLAFLSFHRKGNATARLVLQETLDLVQTFRSRYPALAHTPLANDEADPLTGWWRSESWRADSRYACLAARIAVEHLSAMVRSSSFPMHFLSNDNAFLSTAPHHFTQRTLLARFQMNNTQPTHSQFFVKPIYVGLALMSLLGDREIPLHVDRPDSRVLLLAGGTWHRNSSCTAAVLLVFNNETAEDHHVTQEFNLSLPTSEWCPMGIEPRYSLFVLDNVHGSASAVWERAGSPSFPEPALRRAMRLAQGPYRPVVASPVPDTLSVRLHLPSLAVLQLCTRPRDPPGKVTDLHAVNVTAGELLLLWSDRLVRSKCLVRYDVQWRPRGSSEFHTINADSRWVLPSFHYQLEHHATRKGKTVTGEYRVRALDFWNRAGKFSNILIYVEIKNV